MKKIFLTIILIYSSHFVTAQTCKMEVGNKYNIYLFPGTSEVSLKDIFGAEVNPMLVFVIRVKNADEEKRINERCLKTIMENAIFVFPDSEKTRIKIFCSQEDYKTHLDAEKK